MANRIKIILSLFCIFIVAGIFAVSDSRSFFSDSVRSTGNVISTGHWESEDAEDLELGDVIISEIHWAGSPASNNDQWIELFNTTEKDISLKGWVIENAGKSPKGLKITGNATIEAESYLLITRRKPVSAESALDVQGNVQNGSLYLNRAGYGQLLLKDSEGNVIDGTPKENGSWPAGEYAENERYYSMQRSADTEINGTSTDSWHTCEYKDRMNTLWKDEYFEEYDICGTPGESEALENSTEGQSQDAESASDKDKNPSPEGETRGVNDDKKKDVEQNDLTTTSDSENPNVPEEEKDSEKENDSEDQTESTDEDAGTDEDGKTDLENTDSLAEETDEEKGDSEEDRRKENTDQNTKQEDEITESTDEVNEIVDNDNTNKTDEEENSEEEKKIDENDEIKDGEEADES